MENYECALNFFFSISVLYMFCFLEAALSNVCSDLISRGGRQVFLRNLDGTCWRAKVVTTKVLY
jgi:hypothetical protein